MLDILRSAVNSIPFFSFVCWMGLLIAESIRANPKISALAKRIDPEALFIRKYAYGMGFSANRYWVDKNHPSFTPQVQEEWDKVYGAHWRRIVAGFIVFPVVLLSASLLYYLLRQIIF